MIRLIVITLVVLLTLGGVAFALTRPEVADPRSAADARFRADQQNAEGRGSGSSPPFALPPIVGV